MGRFFDKLERLESFGAKARATSVAFRYSAALLLVVSAFSLRWAMDPALGIRLPFMFFQTSAILAAWIGGFGAGLCALLLGLLLGDYFFYPPLATLGFQDAVEWITFLANFIPSLLAITLIEFMHLSHIRATDYLAKLEAENLRRRDAEKALATAQTELKDYALKLEERVQDRTVELQKSVRFLEGFCYSIAHDLRAPLRAMRGFVHALHEDYGESLDETGREYTARITDAATRMDNLISDLLDYGRLNHLPINVEPIALDDIVESVLSELKLLIALHSPCIFIEHPLAVVWADRRLLHAVIKHLVTNAIQFRHPRRDLVLRLRCDDKDGLVRVWIHDNGIGIEAKFQQRIFNMFERLDARPSATTGVGLAIVAKSVERMGGAVGVLSDVSKGSSFWFELPRTPKRSKPLTELRPRALNASNPELIGTF